MQLFSGCGGGGSGTETGSPGQQRRPGDLDASFGTNGQVVTTISNYYDIAKKILIQPDGRILVAGESFNGAGTNFVVIRYTSSGEIDQTFGANGKTSFGITLGGGSTSLNGAVLQPDGKIVLAGSAYNGTDNDIVLLRLGADGAVDSSFGTGGVYRSQVGSNECGYALALQGDGKIVVAGFSENNTDGDLDFLMARYTTSGSLDPSFGTNGVVETPMPSNEGERRVGQFTALALTRDNSIIAAGVATIEYQTTYGSRLAITRYAPDGSLDSTFGTSSLTVDASFNWPRDMVLQDDGKIVIAGTQYDPGATRDRFSLTRLTQNGALDLSFGNSGTALAAVGDHYAAASTLAVQSNGEIIVAGEADKSSNYGIALARFNNNGIPDSGFGGGGSVITIAGTGSSNANAVAIQADGKILVTGSTGQSGNIKAFLVNRYYL